MLESPPPASQTIAPVFIHFGTSAQFRNCRSFLCVSRFSRSSLFCFFFFLCCIIFRLFNCCFLAVGLKKAALMIISLSISLTREFGPTVCSAVGFYPIQPPNIFPTFQYALQSLQLVLLFILHEFVPHKYSYSVP